jgi:hypothetical protein
MVSPALTAVGDKLAGPGWEIVKKGGQVPALEEADILALGAVQAREAKLPRHLVDLFLGGLAQGKGHLGQLLLAQAGEEVGLVLFGVEPGEQPDPAIRPLDRARIVAGGHGGDPQLLASEGAQQTELDGAVADPAGVGGQASLIGVAEVLQDQALKGGGQVNHLQGHAQALGNALRPLRLGLILVYGEAHIDALH